MILYGGLSREVLGDTVLLDPIKLKAINCVLKPDMCMVNKRFGHTAVEWNKKMIVFGGEHEFNKYSGLRICLNDVNMFSPENLEWKNIKTSGVIETRRYHCAAMVGKHMLVHGGLNAQSHLLGDLHALNLETAQWSLVLFK